MATVEVMHSFLFFNFHHLFRILDILTYLTQSLVTGVKDSLLHKHPLVNYSSTLICLLVHSIVLLFFPRLCIHIDYFFLLFLKFMCKILMISNNFNTDHQIVHTLFIFKMTKTMQQAPSWEIGSGSRPSVWRSSKLKLQGDTT